jgi:hypothetical protein
MTFRVDPGFPQHFVGKHVAQTGHYLLVHKNSLECGLTAGQPALQTRATQTEGIRALVPNHFPQTSLTVDQPEAAQFALVGENEVAARDTDDCPIKSLSLALRRVPEETAGHTEVE